MLRRFWFVFVPSCEPCILNKGCGITAHDLDDAKSILLREVFAFYPETAIQSVIPDVDVRTLDQGHVVSNMHPPSRRGVWFPML